MDKLKSQFCWCGYPVRSAFGVSEERCEKHWNIKEPKKNKSVKFRGNSKYQKEVLGFKSTKEN